MKCTKCDVEIDITNLEYHIHDRHPDKVFSEFVIEELNLTHKSILELVKEKNFGAAKLALADYTSYVSLLADYYFK